MPKRFGGEFLPRALVRRLSEAEPSDFRGGGVVPDDTPSWGVRQASGRKDIKIIEVRERDKSLWFSLACDPVLRELAA